MSPHTFYHTPIISSMEEMMVYTQNLEVLMRSLSQGCEVAPSTETSFPWKNRDVSSVLPVLRMLPIGVEDNPSPAVNRSNFGLETGLLKYRQSSWWGDLFGNLECLHGVLKNRESCKNIYCACLEFRKEMPELVQTSFCFFNFIRFGGNARNWWSGCCNSSLVTQVSKLCSSAGKAKLSSKEVPVLPRLLLK